MPTAWELPYDLSSARVARRRVSEYATQLRRDPTTTDVLRIIVTELVTNAVVHGAAPVELTMHADDGAVTIEVADGDADTNLVHVRVPDIPPGGRGLGIVASLADAWGARSTPYGKAVWATTQTLD